MSKTSVSLLDDGYLYEAEQDRHFDVRSYILAVARDHLKQVVETLGEDIFGDPTPTELVALREAVDQMLTRMENE